MTTSVLDSSEIDADWAEFAAKCNLQPRDPTAAIGPLDIRSDREAQLIIEGEWASSHPLKSVGYESRLSYVKTRDDSHSCEVKIYRPSKPDLKLPLPLLFVTHGGGWMQGTYVTEEIWLLWPLLKQHDLLIISVDYRLAPEHPFPTCVNDCWDVFQYIYQRSHDLFFDPKRIILAGSSTGGNLAAVISQKARDAHLPVAAVVLNAPVLCDPRHFPRDQYQYTSYEEHFNALLLNSAELDQIWRMVLPDDKDGQQVIASPLLGDVTGLPFHALYVAGQDPVRDEALAYAEKLEKHGVSTSLRVYPGLPHSFAEFWQLKATQQFWKDIQEDLNAILVRAV